MKIYTKVLTMLFLTISVMIGCVNQDNSTRIVTNELKESDEFFNFILRYGYNGKNVLNTYEGTFTKDLVSAGTMTTKLELSEEEKKSILNEMKKIDIFNYSNDFKEYISITPRSDYSLEINYNGRHKTLNWNGNNIPLKSIDPNETDPQKAINYIETNETKPILDLVRLELNIIKIIESKSEYRKLPGTQGGYF